MLEYLRYLIWGPKQHKACARTRESIKSTLPKSPLPEYTPDGVKYGALSSQGSAVTSKPKRIGSESEAKLSAQDEEEDRLRRTANRAGFIDTPTSPFLNPASPFYYGYNNSAPATVNEILTHRDYSTGYSPPSEDTGHCSSHHSYDSSPSHSSSYDSGSSSSDSGSSSSDSGSCGGSSD